MPGTFVGPPARGPFEQQAYEAPSGTRQPSASEGSEGARHLQELSKKPSDVEYLSSDRLLTEPRNLQ